MGETETPHFYDFWISGCVPELQNQHSPKEPRKYQMIFEKYYFEKLQNVGHLNFEDVRKDGHREILTIRRMKSWKPWIWDQYLSKNMEWKFGNMEPLWNQETQKL